MSTEVSLAGHRASWRFAGEDQTENWLQTRPWSLGGGVRVVRAGSEGTGDRVVDWITAKVGPQRVEVVPIRAASTRPLRESLQHAFGLPIERGQRALEALARQLRDPVLAVIVSPRANGGHDPVLDAQELVQALGRLEQPAGLGVVLIDAPSRPLAGEADDWTVGMPVLDLVGRLRGPEHELWSAYQHARLAWEAAGQVDRALAWEAARPALRYADDRAHEAWLNELARTQWASEAQAVQTRFEAWLAGTTRPGGASPGAERASLIDGTLWLLPGRQRAQPAPWAARAWLLADRGPGGRAERHVLRASVVCDLLGRQLLARCFELETLARGTWSGSPELSAEVAAEVERFTSGSTSSARCYYPAEHPALPTDDPVAFLSLGQLAHHHPKKRLRDLARLRNAIVHGHYVSWKSIADLRAVELDLA